MSNQKQSLKPISRRKFISTTAFAITAIALPFPLTIYSGNLMTNPKHYDVIIIGGSYSGLAAAMALARALFNVLIIDATNPCNRNTPQSHNFITHDGKTPAEISAQARQQLSKYSTVTFFTGFATHAKKSKDIFEIQAAGKTFHANKLIFATGITDIFPEIPGFAECWGISALHCPFCHGYEVRNDKTGIIGNGVQAFELLRLISNWTNDLTLYTNGTSALTPDQTSKLLKHHIKIVDKKINKLEHLNGYVQNIIFNDDTKSPVEAIYSRLDFVQHSALPQSLGCELTEEGYIKVNPSLETTIDGISACGDNATKMRAIATAVAMGTTAGMMLTKKIIAEAF